MHKGLRPIRTPVAALALAALTWGAAPAPGHSAELGATEKPIRLALNEWTGQHVTTTIAGELLKKMGYQVEYVTAGYYAQLTALGEGELDATLEIWSNNIGEGYGEALASGKIVELGILGLTGGDKWYYPAFVEEMCPGLPDWTALKQCADIFAVAETAPKGRFVEYPAEWGNTGNPERFAALGLDFTPIPSGSEGSMIAEINSAFERRSPLLIQFWSPHWLHAVRDMRIVELPPYEEACVEDPSWGVNPEATYDCGIMPLTVFKVVQVGMEKQWPAAIRFLENYTLTNEIQEPLMKAVGHDGRDLLEVVQEWIEANQAVWEPWIEAAREN